jgi:hypothetical protein
MPYNAMLKDEQSGETLQLWAVLSESPAFKNTISGEPIDTRQTGGRLTQKILNDHIHHEALELSITVDLVGGPGGVEGSVGGPGYEVEQYNKLVDFVNRDTTFAYTSYIFVNSSPRGDTVIPGLVFPFLGMAEFIPVKEVGKGSNIIGARIKFQSVVVTYGGQLITDPDVAYGTGQGSLQTTFAQSVGAFQFGFQLGAGIGAVIGSIFGPIGTLIGAGIGGFFGGGIAVGTVPVNTGSVPRQIYDIDIGDHTFTVELRSNPEYDIVTFGLALEGEDLVRERRITYGLDLLAGVTHSSVYGMHIVPLDPSGHEDAVTTENLGRTVHLVVFQES